MKEYFNVKEAGRLLGVSAQTLRNWEKQGKLIPFRNPINNYRMYSKNQIEKFIEKMEKERRRWGKFRVQIIEEGV